MKFSSRLAAMEKCLKQTPRDDLTVFCGPEEDEHCGNMWQLGMVFPNDFFHMFLSPRTDKKVDSHGFLPNFWKFMLQVEDCANWTLSQHERVASSWGSCVPG